MRRNPFGFLIIYDEYPGAWRASLQRLEAVQSSGAPQLLRVATMNCGAIGFAVEFPLSIDTFLSCGG
jgi:hypothetical protein